VTPLPVYLLQGVSFQQNNFTSVGFVVKGTGGAVDACLYVPRLQYCPPHWQRTISPFMEASGRLIPTASVVGLSTAIAGATAWLDSCCLVAGVLVEHRQNMQENYVGAEPCLAHLQVFIREPCKAQQQITVTGTAASTKLIKQSTAPHP
jgi:hypothetical protein